MKGSGGKMPLAYYVTLRSVNLPVCCSIKKSHSESFIQQAVYDSCFVEYF